MSTLEFGYVHLLRNLCHPTTQKEAICKEKATTKDTLHICMCGLCPQDQQESKSNTLLD